jgi:hypothetical protein
LALTAPAGVVVVVVGILSACTTNALTAKGGACFQSIDCQDGLVCIPTPGADGGGTCTDDLTTIVSLPEAGGDGAMADVAVTPDGSPDTSVPDVGVPDNNVPDSNPPADTGAPDTGGGDAATD